VRLHTLRGVPIVMVNIRTVFATAHPSSAAPHFLSHPVVLLGYCDLVGEPDDQGLTTLGCSEGEPSTVTVPRD